MPVFVKWYPDVLQKILQQLTRNLILKIELTLFTVKVERSSLDQVKARFAMNKKKKEDDSKKKDYDFDSRIKELENEVCLLF